MAKEESDVVTMLEALETAFHTHPVGLLTPKKKLFHPGQPVQFLGHSLTPQSGGHILIEPDLKNRKKFERIMGRKVNHLKYEKLSAAVRIRAQRKARRYVQSWTATFKLCDDIGAVRAQWLMKIAKAS
jgi:hypothetical protein